MIELPTTPIGPAYNVNLHLKQEKTPPNWA